jgi:predicted TIM-barrel fold metal-dependent hydrolase
VRIITLEEHFVSRALVESVGYGLGAQNAVDPKAPEITDIGELRLKHMDESGIDMQAISHVVPTFASIPMESQIEIATGANNQAARAIADHPDPVRLSTGFQRHWSFIETCCTERNAESSSMK